MILAHAFGQRYTLPLPLLLFVLGGGVVVAASFALVLPRAVQAAPSVGTDDRVPLERPRPALGVAAVVVLGLLIVCGLVGSQEVPENIVPTTFWLLIWIAVPLTCGVLGDWTPPVNPLRAIARFTDSDRARRLLLGSAEPVRWPTWLAWWPAVVTYLFLVGGELVYNLTATLPRMIAYGLIAAALASALGGLLFGADAWLNRGEMFSVLLSTWGRLGYWRLGAHGRRGWAGGLDVPFEPVLSRVVFVIMLLASVAFDGLLATPSWHRIHLHLNSATGGNSHADDALTLLVFVGIVVVMLAAFGAFAVAAAHAGGHDRARPGGRFPGALAALLPSLAPISFGYLFAHNIDNLTINGQLLIPLIGNPTGLSGGQWAPAPFDDSYEIKLKLVPPALNWYLAVAIIVAAHVLAVVVAHRHLALAGRSERLARRSEYPWIVAMIAYTMLSLWLLAQPLTKDKPATTSSATAAVSVVAPGRR